MKIQPEEREARDFFRLASISLGLRLSPYLIHHTNDRRVTPDGRGFATHKIKVAMGWQKGVADYQLALPMHGRPGLWLELKAAGGSIEEEQVAFLARQRAVGYACCVAWNASAAVAAVRCYMAGQPSGIFDEVVGFPLRSWDDAEPVLWAPLGDLTKTGTVRKRPRRD